MGHSTTTTTTNANTKQQFSKLQEVLNQTADDATGCLKTLKTKLHEYDSAHGHHLTNTAKSYLRDDLRKAKDSAQELKHVAHDISKSKEPSESDVQSARNMMDAASTAMSSLKTSAREYDEKNGKSNGVADVIDDVLTGKDEGEKERKEKHKKEESKLGAKFNEVFGKKDADDKEATGKSGEEKESPLTDLMGASDTVEAVVKKTLSENFDGFRALKHQISAAEKADSPSMVDRAKEAVHEVKDKLKGDSTSSPTKGDRHRHKAQNAHQSTQSA